LRNNIIFYQKKAKDFLEYFIFRQISQNSLKLIFLAWILGVFGSFLDIYLSSRLSANIDQNDVYYLVALFTIRTCTTLACNYIILKFSLSVEIDLKCLSIKLSNEYRDNFFKLISFNAAHMAFTGMLRIVIEITTLLILAAYIAYVNDKLFIISFLYAFFLLLLFIISMKISNKVRQRAADEQEIFLKKAGDFVHLSDRANQLGTLSFFSNKIRFLSKNYKIYTINSLFVAQSFKPFFELLVLCFAIYIFYENYLIGPIIYIYYRIANGLLIIANNLPLIDHYIKQYRSYSK
jgi:hypothetical protein